MSKYSLQLEEQDSYLSHQRAVDEQRILHASQTLTSSPGNHSSSQVHAAATRPGRPRANPSASESSDVDYGNCSVSGTSTSATTAGSDSSPVSRGNDTCTPSSAPLRMQSAYLQEVGHSRHGTININRSAWSEDATSPHVPPGVETDSSGARGEGVCAELPQKNDMGEQRISLSEKAATSLYLKEELSQLDSEIGK